VREWELAVEGPIGLGEAPFWDDERQCLWFVDITEGVLYRLDPGTGEVAGRRVGSPLSAAIPAADGALILIRGNGVYRYDWDHATTTLIAAIDPPDATIQLNDAACDPRGRLWAGTIDANFGRGRSSLLRFSAAVPDTVLSSRGLANGIAWSPDGATMYFADSQQHTIEAFDYNVESGSVSQPRVWLTLSEPQGFPDGLAVDARGDVWVALYAGAAVHHYSDEGALVEVLQFPVDRVTNMCFGGADLVDLYVTTSSQRLTPAEQRSQPLAGATFVVPRAGTGQPSRRWNPATMRRAAARTQLGEPPIHDCP
jgi:sugar lactone lactonase YvrE